MLRPHGYGVLVDPSAGRMLDEHDTFTCRHCQRIVKVKPRCSAAEAGGWCSRCAAPICGRCTAKGRCTPWEAQMDRIEARDRALRSYGL